MTRLKLWVLFAGIAIFAAACGQTPNTSTANTPVPGANSNSNVAAVPSATVDDKTLAKDLYAKNCAVCHKDTGKGGEVTIEGKTINPKDITTAKMKAKTDDQLFRYISDGFPADGMPAFKTKLSPDQIKAIIGHVRVLQGS